MDTKKLWQRLQETPATEFSVGGEATELPAAPGLTIEGIGEVALPIVDNLIFRRVVALCAHAPFGRGMDTLVDTSVRKTWQLEPSQFSFNHPDWNTSLKRLLLKVGKEMGFQGAACHAYKLLIYEAGGHFVFHRDTEKEPGMFATLVVQLPSRFAGGRLVVKHQQKTRVYDFGCTSGRAPFMVHFAAHFADLEHKIEEVQSGIRVAVVYNICWVKPGPAPSAASPHTSSFQVASILAEWDLTTHSKFAFCLEHQYTYQGLFGNGVAALKGNDKTRVNVLLDANSMLNQNKRINIYVALAVHEIVYSGSCDHHYFRGYGHNSEDWELSDDRFDISHWFDVNGHEIKAEYFVEVDIEKDFLNEFWADDKTAKTEVEYTGNEGATKTTVYNGCIVAFWPAEHETALILSNGGVSLGVKMLTTFADKCSLASTPEEKSKEVKQFEVFFSEKLLQLLRQSTKHEVISILPSIASLICQVSDVTSAHLLLSQLICNYGLGYESITSAIVSIGSKFGWVSIISLVLPFFSGLNNQQIGFGVELFVKMVEDCPSLLEDHNVKSVGANLIRTLSLDMPFSVTSVIPNVGKVCLLLNDCLLSCEFLSYISGFGIRTIEISKAVANIIHHFGIEAFIGLIPKAFSTLSGSEEGASNLLATLLLEHCTHSGLLISIVRKLLTHLVKMSEKGKEYASGLVSAICKTKDPNLCWQLLIDVLLPIGLGPDNSIVADAVNSITPVIGWSAIRDTLPSFFQQPISFCREAYQSLLSSILKEDVELGHTCCSMLAQKAILAAMSSPLPAKDMVFLIIEVFLPLGDIAVLTTLISCVLQCNDLKTISDIVTGLCAGVSPTRLNALPLSSLIAKRTAQIVTTLQSTPYPSWKLPDAVTMPLYHAEIVAFLQSNAEQKRICGFSNITEARKFVKRHQSQLPVKMQEGGSGPRAYVNISKTPQLKTDMLHRETRLLLEAELKELCALVPARVPSLEASKKVETPLSVINISTPPSSSRCMNAVSDVTSAHYFNSSNEVPSSKRMKRELEPELR